MTERAEKKGKLSRKVKVLVASGLAVGMAVGCATSTPPPPATCYSPVALPPRVMTSTVSTPEESSFQVMCYRIVMTDSSSLHLPPMEPFYFRPVPTPAPILTASNEILSTPTPESRDWLREQLLTEGRFPESVAQELK